MQADDARAKALDPLDGTDPTITVVSRHQPVGSWNGRSGPLFQTKIDAEPKRFTLARHAILRVTLRFLCRLTRSFPKANAAIFHNSWKAEPRKFSRDGVCHRLPSFVLVIVKSNKGASPFRGLNIVSTDSKKGAVQWARFCVLCRPEARRYHCQSCACATTVT